MSRAKRERKLLALLLAAGAGKLWRKIRELQAQQDIFE